MRWHTTDMDADNPLASFQAATCTHRIALGSCAGQKVLRLRTMLGWDENTTAGLCIGAHGLSQRQLYGVLISFAENSTYPEILASDRVRLVPARSRRSPLLPSCHLTGDFAPKPFRWSIPATRS